MLRQIARFAGVGLVATLCHVCLASLLAGVWALPPQIANLAGFFAAFGLSYLGHARVTFQVRGGHGTHLPRFLAVAALGLTLSSGMTWLISDQGGHPVWMAMIVVGLAVPSLTYVLSRLWAFAPVQGRTI